MAPTASNDARPLSKRVLNLIKIEAVFGLPATFTTPEAIAARRFVEREIAALRAGGCIEIPEETEEPPEPPAPRRVVGDAGSRQARPGTFAALRKKVEPSKKPRCLT